MKPYYLKNSEVLDPKKFDFLEHYETKLYVEVTKLEPAGIPPLPRFLHSSENIGKYLYVFGGWNDSIYS